MENYKHLGKIICTATNKKAWNLWNEYENASITSVQEAYKASCSNLKIQAENDIKKRMLDENGHGYKILSANGFNFKCGYLIPVLGGTTYILTVDTKTNTYRILMNGIYNYNR